MFSVLSTLIKTFRPRTDHQWRNLITSSISLKIVARKRNWSDRINQNLCSERKPTDPLGIKLDFASMVPNFCMLLVRNARLFFIYPPTKKRGTILKFGTSELAECKKCGCVAVGKRYF